MLAHLLILANRTVPADQLIAQVWDDDPPRAARSTLQGYVSHLRRAVGADRVVGSGRGYRLVVDPDEVDALRFARLVAEGRRQRPTNPAAAGTVLREALDLWQGPPFADLADAASLQPEIARLTELQLSAVEDRIAADLDAGHDRDLVGELEALTAEHPLRERLWGQLMVALYRSGRQGDALGAFDRARALLAGELGIDPSPELRALHERVLRQDPALQSATPTLKGYRLVERIGEDASGAVWRATQPGTDRDVAIRAAAPALVDDAEFIRRFDIEAQRVARIEHPHVVPLYDFWREPEGAYLVFRYLRGGSLRDRLASSGPPEHASALRIADQIAQALGAAHALGVVHSDLASSQVLFDDQGNAYLTGFTVATLAGGAARVEHPRSGPGRPDDPASDTGDDVHAFGILLAELMPDAEGAVAALVDRLTSHHLAGPRDGGELLGELRAAVAGTQAGGPAGVPPLGAPAFRNPYKGLRAFTEGDAPDFFGRDAVVARLLSRLREPGPAARFLAVVGPSGSGKSSVVRAGLVPALRAGGALTGSNTWFIAQMVPGDRPFQELATALRHVTVDPPDDLADRLRADGMAVVAPLLADDGDLLLVIDQFEELFALVTDAQLRQQFIDELVGAVTAAGSRVRVVVTLRADFYDRPLEHPGLGALMQARTETLLPLTATELERAVTVPAERVGVAVERPLVAQVVTDVADQPGALPLLQYALTELFDARADAVLTVDAYRAIGGIAGALSRRADAIFTGLPDDGARHAARQLFLRLVTPGEGVEDTRQRALVADVTALAPDHMPEVLRAFGDARLLSFDRDPDTRAPTVEVAHEALLREWRRLRGWIDAARDDLRTQRRLQAAARDWDAAGQDASFLATGSQLDQYETWRPASGLVPDALDHDYLDASLAHRERQRAEEAARQKRERALERRSVRRLRVLVGVLAVAALIGGTLTVVAVTQARRAADQTLRAEREARVAVARELAAASVAVVDEDPELGILLALEAVERTRVADRTVLPEAEEALHRAVTSSRVALRVPDLGGSVAWHPDGDVFVTEGPEESGLVDLRDAETGASVLAFTGHDADINDVAFSADGSLLATTGDDGRLRVWNPDSGDLQAELGGDGQVWGVSFSPDGSRVAAAWVNEGVVRVLNLTTDESPLEIRADTVNLADSTSFSPDGERLAIADAPGVVVVDAVTGDRLLQFEPDETLAVGWSPDGRWIASSNPGPTARVTDAESGERHLTLAGHNGDVLRFDWSKDGTRLATGARDGTARVWEVTEGGAVELVAVATPEGAVGGVALSPDGERLLTGDVLVNAARIWDVGITGGAEWLNLSTSTSVPTTAAFTPDGDDLVVTGDGVPAVVWDLAAGTPRRSLGADGGDAFEIEVSPDGGLVATISFDDRPRVRVWDRRSGNEDVTVEEPGFFPEALTWSPDGELLAVAGFESRGESGKIMIVDRTGQQVAEVVEDDNFTPRDVAFGPHGEQLATARTTIDRDDPTVDGVRVWDWARGEVLTDIPVFAEVVAVDPTGTRIATGDVAQSASIWAAGTAERLATLTGHVGDVSDVAFSPDGDTIATSGTDGTVRLWTTESGTEQLVLHGHGGPISSLDFGPDGDRLVSTSAGVARVWALDLDDLIGIAERRLTRGLTDAECREHLHIEACPSDD